MAPTDTSVEDGKFRDMAKDTVELNGKQHMTTDYGIKISDPDHWLRVGSNSNTGPSLLEDQIAREKVRLIYHLPRTSLILADHALRP